MFNAFDLHCCHNVQYIPTMTPKIQTCVGGVLIVIKYCITGTYTNTFSRAISIMTAIIVAKLVKPCWKKETRRVVHMNRWKT